MDQLIKWLHMPNINHCMDMKQYTRTRLTLPAQRTDWWTGYHLWCVENDKLIRYRRMSWAWVYVTWILLRYVNREIDRYTHFSFSFVIYYVMCAIRSFHRYDRYAVVNINSRYAHVGLWEWINGLWCDEGNRWV